MSSLRNLRQRGDLVFPDGNFELQAVGSFQNQIEANRRLLWIVPTVLMINLMLIYLSFRNLPISLVVFSGIPVALRWRYDRRCSRRHQHEHPRSGSDSSLCSGLRSTMAL